jgi:hypothetical protein
MAAGGGEEEEEEEAEKRGKSKFSKISFMDKELSILCVDVDVDLSTLRVDLSSGSS